MAITFLLINLCNYSHNLLSPKAI